MKVKEYLKLFLTAIKGKENDYTKGSINKALFLLAIPMILEMVMESLFAIVDVFFVSRISNNAVATIGITEGVLMLIESVAIGIAMATTALVARRVGEKNILQASEVAIQAILLAVVISLICGIGAYIYTEDILLLMGANSELVAEGSVYTRIILSFNIILMLLFVLNGIFRAAGNASIAMQTLILSNGLNIILDPILIFGLGPISGMGIKGAAIATCIGRGIGVLFQLYVLLKGGSLIKIYTKHLRPNFLIMTRLLKVGAGGAGQFLISTASWLFLIKILAELSGGSNADNYILAGYTIGLRIIIFSILPSWGLANATATLVGQNLGANQSSRAEETVWKAARWNMIFLLIISLIYIFFARPISAIFSSNPLVIEEATTCLVILSLGYIFFAYQMTINQAFNGAGDTYTPTTINFIVLWLIQIPLAYFTAIHLGYGSKAVYGTIVASNIIASLVSIFVFRSGRWKKVKI